ncbi:MAG TPA: DinB family protein [Bradyrhizobium sp.]|nr:DinB family protein [Bradyrhizobium sp.]
MRIKSVKAYFHQMAAYNKWANSRLYEAALALEDQDYRHDVGAFFKSMHGTLNHLLLTDLLWLKRLTGEGDRPAALDAIIHDDRRALTRARADEDDRIIGYVDSLDEPSVHGMHRYANSAGKIFEEPRWQILSHLFNHQTHHRGQAHTVLSICTGREPPSLDLLLMQRGAPAQDLRTLV